jgi:uncharacterized DUF497 family protein
MEFEYDAEKSAANKAKHGIDFDEAQALWDEPRFLAVGRIGEKHWSAIFTLRGARLRLISVRRARKQEIEIYEGE